MATWRAAAEPTLTCKGFERVTSQLTVAGFAVGGVSNLVIHYCRLVYVGPPVGASPCRFVSGHRWGRRRADSCRATGGGVAVPTRVGSPVGASTCRLVSGHRWRRRHADSCRATGGGVAVPTRVGPPVGASPHRLVSGYQRGRRRADTCRATGGGVAVPTRVGPPVGASQHRLVSGYRRGVVATTRVGPLVSGHRWRRRRVDSYRAIGGGLRRTDSCRATGADVVTPTRVGPPVGRHRTDSCRATGGGVAAGHQWGRRRRPPVGASPQATGGCVTVQTRVGHRWGVAAGHRRGRRRRPPVGASPCRLVSGHRWRRRRAGGPTRVGTPGGPTRVGTATPQPMARHESARRGPPPMAHTSRHGNATGTTESARRRHRHGESARRRHRHDRDVRYSLFATTTANALKLLA